MRVPKLLAAVCLAGVVALAVFVRFAGVTLTMDNRSGAPIRDVLVNYGRGEIRVGDIPDTTTHYQSLGKIGEGANFDVDWREVSGVRRQAHFNVYFNDSYVDIQIRFLPNGSVILFDGGEPHDPEV